MLNHLIATIMICLGVANTTPISNCTKQNHVLTATKKNANVVNNYIINAQQTQTAEQNYIDIIGTFDNLATIRHYQSNNSYVNIIADCYIQNIRDTDTDNNNNQINTSLYATANNQTPLDHKITCMLLVMQLTPYNYNINNEINLKLLLNYSFWTSDGGYDGNINYMIMEKRILQTTENWSQYIGQQITDQQPINIYKDMTDINNAFYYSEEIETETINSDVVNTANYLNEFEIGITPRKTNYIAIMWIPKIQPLNPIYREYSVFSAARTNKYALAPAENETLNITGTNIIPDGTYEVIDIPGLMFEVIGMPFAFVSQAFNLTLFPGTPYQVNIANLFLSVIAIFVFVWLLMVFIKMKAGG